MERLRSALEKTRQRGGWGGTGDEKKGGTPFKIKKRNVYFT